RVSRNSSPRSRRNRLTSNSLQQPKLLEDSSSPRKEIVLLRREESFLEELLLFVRKFAKPPTITKGACHQATIDLVRRIEHSGNAFAAALGHIRSGCRS